MSEDEDSLTLEDLSTDAAPAAAGAEPEADGAAPEADGATPEADGTTPGLEAIEETDTIRTAADLAAVYDIPVHVSAVLGKSKMQVSSLLKLGRGAVIELDRKVGEAIDIYVNDRLVARGEVVIVENQLGVTMTEIIKGDQG